MKALILYEALAAMETARHILLRGGTMDEQLHAEGILSQAHSYLKRALDAENLNVAVERDAA